MNDMRKIYYRYSNLFLKWKNDLGIDVYHKQSLWNNMC